MSQIVLAKKSDLDLTETQRQVLRECLFEMVDGQAEEDQKLGADFGMVSGKWEAVSSSQSKH